MAPDTYWIRMTTLVAVALHIVMMIASIVVRTQHNSMSLNAQNPDSFLYSYYKPDILGEFNVSKPSYTINNLSLAYTQRCDGNKQDSDNKLLVLHAAFDANNARRSVQLTWIPVQFHFMGHYQIDGYVLLILIFGFSAFFEAVSYYFVLQSDREDYAYELTYTERPCMWRWMEYAVTSPLQILLVASSLMIRDIYTLYMLLFAQVALVQLGFAVEYAISAKGDDCPASLTVSDIFGVEEAWQTYPLIMGPKPVLMGPKTLDGKLESSVSKKNPCLIDRLFWFSFSPAWLLHGAIWGILIQYFAHQDVDCDEPAQDWTGILIAVVTTQAVGFTSFAVIPLFQALKVGILPAWLNFTSMFPDFLFWFKLHVPEATEKNGGHVLHWAFWYYTVLSAVVKILLGITYMSFVTFFPFATDHNVHRTF